MNPAEHRLIHAMRLAQLDYWRRGSRGNKNRKVKLENAVDRLLASYRKPMRELK